MLSPLYRNKFEARRTLGWDLSPLGTLFCFTKRNKMMNLVRGRQDVFLCTLLPSSHTPLWTSPLSGQSGHCLTSSQRTKQPTFVFAVFWSYRAFLHTVLVF